MNHGGSPTRVIDKHLLILAAACIYAVAIHPISLLVCNTTDTQCLLESRPENKIFWPVLATAAIILALRYRSRLTLPPNMACLWAYLAFAGASVLWAYKPEMSFIRFAQEVMVVTSIVLPALVADRKSDLMRTLFFCFAIAVVLNVFFLLGPTRELSKYATQGYTGYFPGKNYLGECAGIAFLLSLYEILHRGSRRVLGFIVAIISAWLLFLSNSKTALAVSIIAPSLAVLALILQRKARVSPVIIPLSIVSFVAVLSNVFNITIYRLSYMLYGESTFTGRKFIWDFANYEIGQRPIFGWGYQSFWLVGPDAPSVVEAPGWVKTMPNAHNGYLDTMLELGYVGFAFLAVFLVVTLYMCGRLADREPARGWILISLTFYIMLSNCLESTWMRAFEFLWVVFLFVAAEVGRNAELIRPRVRSQLASTTRRENPRRQPERHRGVGDRT